MSEIINNFELCNDIPNKLKKIIKKLYVLYDTKGYNVLFVTLNDKVFGFGSNKYGVCGFGHDMVVEEPQLIEELCDKSIIQFYNGWNFVMALTTDNKLYGWGRNNCGQLAVTLINNVKLCKPLLIEDLNDIIIEQISCGSAHTLVLSNDGMVYGWGSNRYGQIGCGKELGEHLSVITKLKKLTYIKQVHCSYRRSFALTDNGMVYSWGYNGWCDLGHELKQKVSHFEPKVINNLSNIISISSSATNTYFLSYNRVIYYTGKKFNYDNEIYQLDPKPIASIIKGIGNTSLNGKHMFEDNEVISTLTVDKTIYVLKNDIMVKTNYNNIEELYSNEYHITNTTLELNDYKNKNEFDATMITDKYFNELVENDSLEQNIFKNFNVCKSSFLKNFYVKCFHIFDDSNGFNILFVTTDDKVYSFGSNQFGVCGLGHNKNVKYPEIISELCDKNIHQFHNGYTFALGLTCANELYGWGFNNSGQLGKSIINADFNKPGSIKGPNNQTITQISCGSTHTLILTSDGMVYGWGNNYYGQIGCGKRLGEKLSIITELISLPKVKLLYSTYCESFALTDNGMVYSWGYNKWCQLGHELKQNECVFEPKLIKNLRGIISICSSYNSTYFLSINKNIYFCGKYYDKNYEIRYQIIPQLISNDLDIHSIFSIDSYKKGFPLGCALNEEWVYFLDDGEIKKTHYKILEEFYSNECQLTYKTYNLEILRSELKIQGNKYKLVNNIHILI